MRGLLGFRKNATVRREWLGLTCTFIWFFGSMYSYYPLLFSGIAAELVFMLLLCGGLAGSALLADRYPGAADRLFPVTTLSGVLCTGLIPFLPNVGAAVTFWLSALLMAPLLGRRLYGLLGTLKSSSRMTAYISAVSVTIVIQMIWVLLPLDFAIKFPVLSAFALAGLGGSLRRLPGHAAQELPGQKKRQLSQRILPVTAILVLLMLLNLWSTIIHTHAIMGSLNSSDLFSLAAWAVVPFAFLFFAVLSDSGRDRLGFSIGLGLILLGCFTALIPESGIFTAPLLLLGEFGGTVTEYCFLTMPLLFFPYSRLPRLTAVTGLIAHTLLASTVSWTQDLWLPPVLLQDELTRPLVLFGAACALALALLSYSVWRRQEDVTLMAALLGLRKHRDTAAPAEQPATDGTDWTQSLDLTEREHSIARLLCEGLSRAEIAGQLVMPPIAVTAHLNNIREKLGRGQPLGSSPEARRAAKVYGLTVRETEVLSEILLGRSNAEISANLHIEETTVKTHVGKVLKKTGTKNRSELLIKLRT